MGVGGAKFKRNDKIPGQGLQTLVDGKALKIKATQLDRLFHEFNKFAAEDYLMDYEGFLSYHEMENTPFTDLLFLIMDLPKTGLWNFYQYLVTMWNFLSTSEDNLSACIFNMFDIDGHGVLEVFECKYILQLIYIFQPPIFARWAIDKLDLNEDGFVTIAEFALLCRHHPVLLLPLVNMRKKMRKKIVHSRFWREMSTVRLREFGSHTFFDILVLKNAAELKQAALTALLTRDDVPVEYKDKWKDIQVKRDNARSTREVITKDLPPETLTDVQMGLRLMFPVTYTANKKNKDKGAFHQLHTDYEDESALQQDSDDRLNNLVENLKAQHARQQHSKKKANSKSKKKSHTSVKPVMPGIPTPAAPEPVGAQGRGTANMSDRSLASSSSGMSAGGG